MAISKVSFHGDTLVDLTGDTVTPEALAQGVTAHNAAGERIVGTGGSLKFQNVSVLPEYVSRDDRYPMYPYRVTIPLTGATAGMLPIVAIAGPDGENGIFKATAESFDGGVCLWAVCQITEDITIDTIALL